MTIPSPLLTLLLGMVLVLAGLWIGQNVSMLPVDASVNAPVYDDLFRVLFSIGTILFLGIVGLLIFSLVRFRRRAGELGDGAAIEGNLPLEIVWTAIPAIVVLFVGIYSYDIYERMGGMTPLHDHEAMMAAAQAEAMGSPPAATPAAAVVGGSGSGERVWGGIAPAIDSAMPPLAVDVTAMQFAFLFHYPEGDFISGELHVPVDRPVQLTMKANDVIHAFWVPQFRLKQDVIPGQPTLLSFTATRPGSYPIVCAELCGPYHGGMRSTVVVHESDDFDTWLSNNRPAPVTLSDAGGTPTG
ncbi:MAG: cytochrome c oxidase subunit II [Cyanobacteriota bacterium]|nr:cytochrome c oxidase subunit II [Cyanobacteriota bacterium]